MECFVINSNEVEGRIDSFYYKPEFKELERKINRLKCKKIVDICFNLKNGSTPKGGVFENSGIPYFRSQDFNLFDFETNQFINEEFHQQLSRSAVIPNDVLLAVVGATLGVVGFVPEEIREGNINQNVVRIRVKDKEINPKFLAIVLSSKIGQKLILRNATIQTQAYLNNSQLGKIEIPIPSIENQNKIISLTDKAYSEKKQKETQAKELLDSISDYVLDELGIKLPELKDRKCYIVNSEKVKERVDPYYYQPKFTELYKSIKAYKRVTCLKDIVEELDYGLMPTQDYATSESEGVPMIRVTNILQNGSINMSDVKYIPFNTPRLDLKRVKENDILMVQCGSTTGKVAIVPKKYENYTFGSFSFVIRGKKELVSQTYLLAILLSQLVQEQIKHTWNIVTVRPNTSKPNVENLLIPLPPLAVQNKIAEELKNRIQKAEQLQKEAKEELEKAKQEVEKIILS